MKPMMLYACVLIFLTSCQKEIFLPEKVKENATQVKIPDILPEPKPEEPVIDSLPEEDSIPQPDQVQKDPLDPPPGEISESVYLSNLFYFLNSDSHYKLAKVYSDRMNLWLATPEWTKDDIHTFGKRGQGTIESPGKDSPAQPFDKMDQRWSAYAVEDAIKLNWVDQNYNPVTYTLIYAVPGKYFKACRMVNGVKTYFIFQAV